MGEIDKRKYVPPVGSIVSPSGTDIRYRVVSTTDYGCNVEAIDTVVEISPGRTRPLAYNEKRFTLAVNSQTGGLFDRNWRGWHVVSRAGG